MFPKLRIPDTVSQYGMEWDIPIQPNQPAGIVLVSHVGANKLFNLPFQAADFHSLILFS